MSENVRNALLVMVCATQAACAAGYPALADHARHQSGSIELRRDQLGTGVSLLTSLDERVVGLGVVRGEAGCPILSMRGRRTLVAADQPAVYVNGARVRDTCVLDLIPTREVERVRVFQGAAGASAPGLIATPAGLIVVETRGR
jgi:hypothetical protein